MEVNARQRKWIESVCGVPLDHTKQQPNGTLYVYLISKTLWLESVKGKLESIISKLTIE